MSVYHLIISIFAFSIIIALIIDMIKDDFDKFAH